MLSWNWWSQSSRKLIPFSHNPLALALFISISASSASNTNLTTSNNQLIRPQSRQPPLVRVINATRKKSSDVKEKDSVASSPRTEFSVSQALSSSRSQESMIGGSASGIGGSMVLNPGVLSRKLNKQLERLHLLADQVWKERKGKLREEESQGRKREGGRGDEEKNSRLTFEAYSNLFCSFLKPCKLPP